MFPILGKTFHCVIICKPSYVHVVSYLHLSSPILDIVKKEGWFMSERHVVPQYMDHCKIPMSFNSSLPLHHPIFTPSCPLWQAVQSACGVILFMRVLMATKIWAKPSTVSLTALTSVSMLRLFLSTSLCTALHFQHLDNNIIWDNNMHKVLESPPPCWQIHYSWVYSSCVFSGLEDSLRRIHQMRIFLYSSSANVAFLNIFHPIKSIFFFFTQMTGYFSQYSLSSFF